MRRLSSFGVTFFVVPCLLAIAPSRAAHADGDLDPAFDGDGKKTVAFDIGPIKYDFAYDVTEVPNGRLVVVGGAEVGTGNEDFAFAVLGANGALDNSFSLDGKQTLAFNVGPSGQRDDAGTSVIVQPDGKILVCGSAESSTGTYRLVVARLLPNGELDADFGNGGEVLIVPYGVSSVDKRACGAMVLRKNGKIVLPFSSGTGTTAGIVQLEDDGDYDPAFSDDGISDLLNCTNAATQCYLSGVIELADGKFMALGTKWTGSQYDLLFGRYTRTGQLDTTFSGDGQLTITYPTVTTNDTPIAAAVDHSGRLVVLFYAVGGGNHYVVTRITSAGAVDASFGASGFSTVDLADPPASQTVNGLIVQGDGKILAAGYYYDSAKSESDCGVVRFTADAKALDVGFALGGRRPIDFGDEIEQCFGAKSIAGRPVVVGFAQPGSTQDMAIARLTSTHVFADGFESGTTFFWPTTAP